MTAMSLQVSPGHRRRPSGGVARCFPRPTRLVFVVGLMLANVLGCRTHLAAPPAMVVPPEPSSPHAAWQTAARPRLRPTRQLPPKPSGLPAIPGPPSPAFVVSPVGIDMAPPVSSAAPELFRGALAPNTLEVFDPLEVAATSTHLSPPLMPPACEVTPAGPEPSPPAFDTPPSVLPAPAPMTEAPPAAWEQLETRVQALESQLETSRNALHAMTAALQSAHSQIARLQTDVDDQKAQVEQLEAAMEERHQADLERLTRLSAALDQLIQRETRTSAPTTEVLQ